MRVFFFRVLIGHDFAISHGDNTVKILLVPVLVGDHHHNTIKKTLVLCPKSEFGFAMHQCLARLNY